MAEAKDIREPAVAGQFYTLNPKLLSLEISNYLRKVPPQKIDGKVIALMVPHAGYIYSGQTAAYSYKIISDVSEKEFQTVIIIGNSHNYYLKKGAVYNKGRWRTPLGDVEIDEKLAEALLKNSNLLESNLIAHIPEHSLEVQLPFLQMTLKNFKIVPILLSGVFSLKDCEKLAMDIATAIKNSGKKTLILASSDMSHFPTDRDARVVDLAALKAIESFNVEKLAANIDESMSKGYRNLSCVLCGQEAVYTTMYCAKLLGADKAVVLNYSNSSDVSGDKSRVVGYGAVAFVKTEVGSRKTEIRGQKQNGEFMISEKNQKFLLELARKSITEYLSGKKSTTPTTDDPELTQPSSVFVTLTQNNRLRGCIGNPGVQKPLIEAVREMAIAAATEDPRFPKLTPQELKNTKIEISILSPMRRVKSADEIKQNIHGVVVRKGIRSGLFLPQVWEHFSTKEEFLSELCWQKAGLEPAAWKDSSTELYVFTVFKFEE